MTTDPLTIISEQKRFYQELRTSGRGDGDKVNNAETVLDIPKLTEEQKHMCEGKILDKECELMLRAFQNNKVPRNDGIPVEFYKKFWTLLSEPFVKCANGCFENMEMSNAQKQAVISLIEKKEKSTHSLKTGDRSLFLMWMLCRKARPSPAQVNHRTCKI